MIYVSEETIKDIRNRHQRKGPAEHIIVLRDTVDKLFRLESPWRDLPFTMKSCGVKLEDVCGLARSGYQTVFVTPLSPVEVTVGACLCNPRITKRQRNKGEFTDSYFRYGWYNVAVSGGACSVPRLILEKCPDEVNTIGGRIECGQDIVHVCCGENFQFDEYLTYDLCDVTTFHRIRAKRKMLGVDLTYNESFPIEWKEMSKSVVHPRCRVVKL